MRRLSVATLCTLLLPVMVVAQSATDVATESEQGARKGAVATGLHSVLADSRTLNLSSHHTWHRLLHYQPQRFSAGDVLSAIHSPEFFHAQDGATDPQQELEATLAAFFLPAEENLNDHAQCRFRGRFIWLDRQLDFDSAGLQRQPCPEFEQWTQGGSVSSVSVVLATGYLGNPASYYGHTLLKLNSSRVSNRSSLEDMSVNYGAIVPPDDGPLRYILNGLFGGYSGGFSDIQYYFHNHHYGESELRDMWEYELDLSQDDVDLVVGHAWEILGREYTYYFLRQNCAYQMAQLLAVVEGLDVTPANPLWNLPQTLLTNIAEETYQGRPLVKAVTYHPSRQARLYHRFSSLSDSEQREVATVIEDIDLLRSDEFRALPLDSQRRTLDTLLDYYQFVRNEDELERDINNHYYAQVLAARFATAAAPSQLAPLNPEPPHTGRAPSLLRLSALSHQQLGSGAALTLRPAYYDALDGDHAHVPGAELKMGELQLKLLDGQLRLDALNLFAVESVHRSSTGLPGDKASAWRLSLGAEQQSLACDDCLVTRFRGDLGYTFSAFGRILSGAYVGASVHDNRNGIGNASAHLTAFSTVRITDAINLRVELERAYNLGAALRHERRLMLESRFRLSRNVALRLSYSKHGAEEFALGVERYF